LKFGNNINARYGIVWVQICQGLVQKNNFRLVRSENERDDTQQLSLAARKVLGIVSLEGSEYFGNVFLPFEPRRKGEAPIGPEQCDVLGCCQRCCG
jgi:hypothetical protein